MNTDVVTIDHKIILNPEFGDQTKMIKKNVIVGWNVAFTSLRNLVSYFAD